MQEDLKATPEATVLTRCGLLRFSGLSFDGAIKVLETDPDTRGWMRDIGLPGGAAEFVRIWKEADLANLGIGITEDGTALAFADAHRDELRYDHDAASWYQWTGTHWRQERTRLAFAWARGACRSIAKRAELHNARGAAPLMRAAAAAGVERFAQSDRAFAVTSDLWDRDPMLLGTPGGTVDLATGELRHARPGEHITKQTAVAPADVPEHPQWDAFLHAATGGDKNLIGFLCQWAGYCLTGITREHALVFIWGPGGNGKSVFINTLNHILGDYAVTSSMATFSASSNPRHETELAALRGARMVVANETEEGRAWSETRVKQLTGGDRIAARFMRQDFFQYTPEFKLCVVGNNKPPLRNVDDAIKRRINMVPFVNRPDPPDPEMEQKLRAEAPQILRWAIKGCLDWQKNGLVQPQVVLDATKDYFDSQDHFGRWLAECCDTDKNATASAKPSVLLYSYQQWCARNGEPTTDNRQLRGMLERLPGVSYKTVNGTQSVQGIALKSPPPAARVEGGGG